MKITRFAGVLASVMLAGTLGAEPVEFRGVVEGYYGRPWGTEGRLSMLDFMGANGMNVFIYGPKDDPYHHAKWREAYPADEVADFRRLLASAQRNHVELYWAIHLGDGYHRGNAGDRKALFDKLGWMYDIGFRAFAIFFDDFGGDDAAFHAETCNDVQRNFLAAKGDCAKLLMCPHEYWGSGRTYQRTLGEKLDPEVRIMWTGRGICSDITAEDVRRITEDFRRPPFVWWNWPVNDFCRRSILLGRTYGLDDCKFAGFVSNPMENCEASKIALYGIAKWCRNPQGFDSESVWEETFKALYPDPEIAAAMRVFAEHNADPGENAHGFRREESVSVRDLVDRATRQLQEDGAVGDTERVALSMCFRRLKASAETLLAKLPADRGLGWELKGWLENEKFLMEQALLALGPDEPDFARKLAEIRAADARAAEANCERFRAATFADDRQWVTAPRASGMVLRPFVKRLLLAKLEKLVRGRFGTACPGGELRGFSTAAELPRPNAVRESKFAKLERILEPKTIRPGETFGIAVPADWKTDYFHARLGNAEAAGKGVIEVSRDGREWQRLEVRVHDGEMESRLDVDDGWRQARYRNASDGPVTVKLDLFKFDIRGDYSPIDALVKRLLD